MRYTKGKWVAGYRDTFSLSHTLSPIIGAALLKYREVVYGHPMESWPSTLTEKFIEDGLIKSTTDIEDEEFEKCLVVWREMVDKMIFSFIEENNFAAPNKIEYDLIDNEDGTRTRICLDPEGLDENLAAMKVHNAKVQEGFELFGKYYQGLWW